MLYNIAKHLVHFVIGFKFRLKSEGRENVPKEGPVIIAVNHKSNNDPVVTAIACPRELSFMAKEELFKNKLFGALIKKLGAFPIRRGAGDIGAVKTAFKIFKADGAMLIFPEGGRVKNGAKRRAKPGVAMLASRSGVPVIPVYIDGDYRFGSTVTVKFGKAISFAEYVGKKLSGDEIQELADMVLEEIYKCR